MGQYFCKLGWFKKKDVRLLMHGLDAAGKTTIMYMLKLGEVVSTIPTIGFNVETVTYKNINITSWDVGGRGAIRPLYRHYYPGTDAVLFVVDSNDLERMEQARDELVRLLEEKDLKDTVFLVLANKQDLPGAMTVPEVAKAVDFQGILKTHRATIIGCSAISGEGLNDALHWMSQEFAEGRSRQSPDANPSDPETDATSEKKTEKSPWSLSTYMKGTLESLKAFLPKLG
ncbi:ADP-ribosylation factor 1-like [Haliotis rufescens]|uniref:ADP-ribosylation factor 1-like n=1 Tax=Haliotis rufescens TaxID=6454 RepID=UPI001EB08277|nr:ADP-ribosylation factor 1-like [Haliotis rufescens]